MRTQAIIDYALKAAAAGASEQEIKNALTQAGWSQVDIDDSIAATKTPQPIPTPAPMIPNLMPKQPSQTPPISTTQNQSAPVQSTVPVNTPYQPIVQPTQQNQSTKGKPIFAIIVIVLLLGSIGGTLAYAYTQQMWIFTPKELTPEELVNRLVDTAANLQSASYRANLTIEVQPRDKDLEVFPNTDPGMPLSDLSDILEDVHASVDVSGNVNFRKKEQPNGTSKLKGNFRMQGINASIDLETIKKDKDLYSRINEFPSIFGSFSKIKGTWVHIPEDESLETLSEISDLDIGTGISKSDPKMPEKIKLFLSTALKEGLISIGKRSEEKVDSTPAYRYSISFDLRKLPQFGKTFSAEFKKRYNEDIGEYFDEIEVTDPEMEKQADYVSKNTTLDLWIERKTGMPIKATYSFRMAPDEDVFSGKQIRATATLALSNINTPPPPIEAPSGAISLDEASMLISGMTKEEYLLQKQYTTILSIQYALRSYQLTTGTYPDSLTDLLKTRAAVTPAQQTNKISSYLADTPFLKKLPVDVYTKQPFPYKKLSNNYSLSYEAHLPIYEKGSSPSYYVYETKYAPYTAGTIKKTSAPSSRLRFVEGINTAVAELVSVEANSKATNDTDKDGISDSFELYLGTDPQKKDSDADGKTDGEEFMSRTNPLGSGILKRRQSESIMPF